MTIATDISTAASTMATALGTIEDQLTILEADQVSDPPTFNKAFNLGVAKGRLYEIGVRLSKLTRSNG